MSQPISAAAEITPRGGLGGALGLGVIIPAADPLDPKGDWERTSYVLEGPACGGTGSQPIGSCAEQQDVFPGTAPWAYAPPSVPFDVYAGEGCSTFSSSLSIEDWHERVDRRIEMCQWSEVAYELWTGEQAQAAGAENRYLASTGSITLTNNGPVSPVEAFSAMEDALALCTCGAVHVIHVPVRLVAYLSDACLIHREGERLYTDAGSLVVADRGYTGSAPGNQAPPSGTLWIYGTSVLSARLGKIVHPQARLEDAIDHENNRIEVRATRRAAISWLCCHFAAHVGFC